MPSIATCTFAVLFAHDDARLPPRAAFAVVRIMSVQAATSCISEDIIVL